MSEASDHTHQALNNIHHMCTTLPALFDYSLNAKKGLGCSGMLVQPMLAWWVACQVGPSECSPISVVKTDMLPTLSTDALAQLLDLGTSVDKLSNPSFMDLFKEVGGSPGRAYNHIMDKREQLSTWWKTVVQSRASAESAKRHDEASSGVKKYYEIAKHAIHNWGHNGCAADGNTENDVAGLKANGRASLELYTSTANCPRDRIRAVVLERIIGLALELADIQEFQLSEGYANGLAQTQSRLDLAHGILNEYRARFAEVNEGWWADCTVLDTGASEAKNMLRQACSCLKEDCQKSLKRAQDMAPPKHILSNPRLLTDTTSQRTVVDNVHRDQLSRLANTLSGCVKVAKVLGSSNLIPLGEGPDIEELNVAKNHCKLAIGMEYFCAS